jgi:hypothetical protein
MRKKTRRWMGAALLPSCFIGACCVGLAQAQSSQALDPSIRAAGTGKAGTAVFWGPDPDYWRNPALLACECGVRYEHGKTQLVPDLADDVYFTSDRLTLAAFGLGLSFEGQPLDVLGGRRLDYGQTEAVDEEGKSYGFFDSWEEVESWGIAVSAMHVLDSVLDLTRDDHSVLRRFGDIGLGVRWNTADVHLAPDWAMEIIGADGSGQTEAHTRDWGYLVRLSPYNSIDYEGWLPALDEVLEPVLGGIAVEAAYGEGTLNDRNDTVQFGDLAPDPISRYDRRGYSIHVAAGFPGVLSEGLESHGLGWLAESLSPMISVGWAWDRMVRSMEFPDPGSRVAGAEQEYSGWELEFANILTLRRGRIDDRDGEIHGDTSGWGLGFKAGDYGGFRYDKATVPQALDVNEVEREGFTVFVDPLTIWRDLHR